MRSTYCALSAVKWRMSANKQPTAFAPSYIKISALCVFSGVVWLRQLPTSCGSSCIAWLHPSIHWNPSWWTLGWSGQSRRFIQHWKLQQNERCHKTVTKPLGFQKKFGIIGRQSELSWIWRLSCWRTRWPSSSRRERQKWHGLTAGVCHQRKKQGSKAGNPLEASWTPSLQVGSLTSTELHGCVVLWYFHHWKWEIWTGGRPKPPLVLIMVGMLERSCGW